MRLTSVKPTVSQIVHIAIILTGAIACGLLAWWVKFPLPWMVGALFFTGSARLMLFEVYMPVQTRKLGQILVASSVGLSFTPDALRLTTTLLVPMALTALVTIAISIMVAWGLVRISRIDPSTAILSILPIGPVESVVLAKRYAIPQGPVMFSQTIRILAIVISIPPIIVFLDGTVADPVLVLSGMEWTFRGAVFLFTLGLAGALMAARIGVPNAYFLGAMVGASLGAVLGLPISPYPYIVLAGAQILLGIWLGSAIDRGLFRNAHTLLPGLVVSSLLLIVLCGFLGLGIAWITGQPWQTMILATAPGSVTEMSLTAKILQEGLAIVTAFHLTRILIIMPFSNYIVIWSVRLLTGKLALFNR